VNSLSGLEDTVKLWSLSDHLTADEDFINGIHEIIAGNQTAGGNYRHGFSPSMPQLLQQNPALVSAIAR